MNSFNVKSQGVVELEGYLWVQSEDFPPNCKESVTIRGIKYFKIQKVK